MVAYRDGAAGAFDELYRRHKGGLYRYLLRQCRDASAAAEMFQDLDEPHTIAGRLRADCKVLHLSLPHGAQPPRRPLSPERAWAEVSLDDDDGAIEAPLAARRDGPDAQHERRALAAQLLGLVEALPAAQREAFVLQHEGGMTVEEIAEATGVTRETAKSRRRRSTSGFSPQHAARPGQGRALESQAQSRRARGSARVQGLPACAGCSRRPDRQHHQFESRAAGDRGAGTARSAAGPALRAGGPGPRAGARCADGPRLAAC